MKLLLASTLAVAAALGATGAAANDACDDGEIVIKFSHVTNSDKHPKGLAAGALEKRVNEEMQGKACMEVFPNAALYTDATELEALLRNDVQLLAPSLSKFETFTKKYRIFDMPFMFTDIDAVDRFQASEEGQKLLLAMKRRGLTGLSFWHNGMKQMSANIPLMAPADAEGLKFRVMQSEVLVAQMKAIGGSPQKMSFSEVYGALQTGVVDGQENVWSNIYGKKFFEVQDGITETNHGVIDYLLVTSTEFWDGLDPAIRDQLNTIIQEVTAERNAKANELNEQAKASIVEAGGVIRTLTPEQRQLWVDVMQPVWTAFEGDVGADVIAAAQAANDLTN